MVRFLCFSDIHGDESFCDKWLEYKDIFDFIVVSGDISRSGLGLYKIAEILSSFEKKVFIIPGNNETPDMIENISKKYRNLIPIHNKVIGLSSDICVIGFGGSKRTPFNTNFEWNDEEIYSKLEMLGKSSQKFNKKILVTHSPPINCVLDLYRGLGSNSIRNFIERFNIDFCICGHVHESSGFITKIGKTICINPGKKGILIEI